MEVIKNLHAAQQHLNATGRVEDRRAFDPAVTWPLLRGEQPKPMPAGLDKQGRYTTRRVNTDGISPAECCTELGADTDDAGDRYAGAGAVVVPAVVACALACAALLAFLGGWL